MDKIRKVTAYISYVKEDDKEFYLSSEIEYDKNNNYGSYQ